LPAKADLAAWLAVAAGSIGSLMATLDVSIVNSSLPIIQGEIGASGTEGTWINSSFLVAEIVIIPLSGWLSRVFGLRNFLMISVSLFIAFSIMCGMATDLPTMIIGRVGTGVAGGALIPTAMTIIATRLPPAQQPIGTAAYASTAILGPLLGPLIGGWLTENIGWEYAFFINIPVGIMLIVLLLLGLPYQKPDMSRIVNGDWLGIIGMSLGLAGMTIVLEEGHRELWFASSFIIAMTAMAVVGFGMMMAGQFTVSQPVIRLKLLLDRQFGAVAILSLVLGWVMFGTSYIIPQFLVRFADYNALQAGLIAMTSGISPLLLMSFVPFLMRKVDIRVAVISGTVILAFSAYLDIGLTVTSSGEAFVPSQVIRGTGVVMTFMFLNQAAIAAVPSQYASDAAGLFNAARNIGGSFGLAFIGTFQDERQWFHARRIEETLHANSPIVQDHVTRMGDMLGNPHAAIPAIEGAINLQALAMAYGDVFWLMALISLAVSPLALLLKPLPRLGRMAPSH